MKKDYVSIILPTHNRASLLSRSIDSILNQTYPKFKLIVVDDGSTDNTKEVINKYKDKRIRFISYPKNRGASYARNTGLREAKYDYIAFQDSDDEWVKDKLEKQMNILKNKRYIDIVYTDMLRIKKNGKTKYWHSPDVKKGKIANRKNTDYQVKNIGLITILMRASCIKKVGLFDVNLCKYIDLDFFIRLAKEYEIFHIKEPMAVYYKTEGISSNYYNGYKARKYMLKKYRKDIGDNYTFIASQCYKMCIELIKDGRYKKAEFYCDKAIKHGGRNIKTLAIKYLLNLAPQYLKIFICRIKR